MTAMGAKLSQGQSGGSRGPTAKGQRAGDRQPEATQAKAREQHSIANPCREMGPAREAKARVTHPSFMSAGALSVIKLCDHARHMFVEIQMLEMQIIRLHKLQSMLRSYIMQLISMSSHIISVYSLQFASNRIISSHLYFKLMREF